MDRPLFIIVREPVAAGIFCQKFRLGPWILPAVEKPHRIDGTAMTAVLFPDEHRALKRQPAACPAMFAVALSPVRYGQD